MASPPSSRQVEANERATPGFRSPSVTFQAEADGKPWRVTYALADGRLSAFPYEQRSTIDARSLLLRLHTAHGFPSYVNARWLWAVAVDAMFVSMVFWGMSGVFSERVFWRPAPWRPR